MDMGVESTANYELFLVSNATSTIYITTIRGMTVKEISLPIDQENSKRKLSSDEPPTCSRLDIPSKDSQKSQQVCISAVCLSPQSKLVFAAGSNGQVYIFDSKTGDFLESFSTGTAAVSGISHHPSRCLLTTFSADNELKVWRED